MRDHARQCLKLKRVTIVVLCVFCVCTALTMPVSAETEEIKATATSFTNDWERTKKYHPDFALELRYGYNTFLINEDYARATSGVVYYRNFKHQAIITNGNGTHYGPKHTYEYMSTVDVRHKGTKVTYYNRATRI